jgi:hypothetical protein
MGGVGGASCTGVTDGEPEGDGKCEGGATSDWVVGGAGMMLAGCLPSRHTIYGKRRMKWRSSCEHSDCVSGHGSRDRPGRVD